MAKRRSRKGSSKTSLGGCLVAVVVLVGLFIWNAVSNSNGSSSRSVPRSSITQSSITESPIPTLSEEERFAPVSVTPDGRPTATPPTPRATITPLDRPTQTTEPQTYYVSSAQAINVRDEPSTSAGVVASLSPGEAVEVFDSVDGDTVSGSDTWYEIVVDDEPAYVHSSLLSRSQPNINIESRPTSNAVQQAASTAVPLAEQPAEPVQSEPESFTCPRNCAGAVEMGLSPEQAASCGLDRDKDGRACYE